MLSCLEDIAVHLFGSWPNLTQGLIGSAFGSGLGVYGAYFVASRQMRHDRDSQRMSAGGLAAATILEALLPLAKQLRALQQIDAAWDYDQQGLSSRHRDRWQECVAAFEVSIVLRAHLLPSGVASDLKALAARLEEAVVWDVDEENRVLVYVDVASAETLQQIAQLAGAAQQSLTVYARSVLGDPR